MLDVLSMVWWPAMLAGLVAIGVTLSIERWGGTIGGLLGTLPTTIVPASLGLASQSRQPQDFEAAMYIVPAGMLLNALFLWLWRVLPPRLQKGSLVLRLAQMSIVSLALWLLAAVGLVWLTRSFRASGTSVFWTGALALLLSVVVGVWACWDRPPSPRGSKQIGPLIHLARGLLAGVAVGTAVWLSSTGNSLLAGVASVFPAIFLTTMIALWLSQHRAVQVGAVGPMMLGSSSVSMYAMLAPSAAQITGSLWGFLLAWLGAVVLTTLPAWWWLSKRGEAQED